MSSRRGCSVNVASWMPALLCSTSMPPKRAAVAYIRLRTDSDDETSMPTPRLSAPAWPTSSAVSAADSSRRSAATTVRAPRRAISTAVSRPIPAPAPVTTHTLPSSIVSPCLVGLDSERGRGPGALEQGVGEVDVGGLDPKQADATPCTGDEIVDVPLSHDPV